MPPFSPFKKGNRKSGKAEIVLVSDSCRTDSALSGEGAALNSFPKTIGVVIFPLC